MSKRWKIGITLSVALLGLAALISWQLGARQRALEAARARWEHQAPQRYLIDVDISGDEVSGDLRIEVDGAQLVSVHDRATGAPLDDSSVQALSSVLPIGAMFDLIEHAERFGRVDTDLASRHPQLRSILWAVGLAPAQCWDPVVLDVAYDSQWGYPRELRWDSRRCDSGMFSLDRFSLTIVAFQPLP